MVSLLSFMNMMRYFIQHVGNTNVHIGKCNVSVTNSARWIYWEKCMNLTSAQNFQVEKDDKLENTNAYIIFRNDHGCTLLAAMVMDVMDVPLLFSPLPGRLHP